MTDLMFEDFKLYYPSEGRRAVKHWVNCTYELYIRLDDGTLLAFDYLDKSIRKVRINKEALTDNDRMSEFGRKLNRLLYAKGLTQNDLSELTGISQSMLSLYITGRVVPSFMKVDKICRALGCSMDSLRWAEELELVVYDEDD